MRNTAPGRFPGLVFQLKKPRTSTLIFGSGKIICTGARSEKEAERALRKLVKVLKEGGILIMGKPEIKIVNVVATVNSVGLSIFQNCMSLKEACAEESFMSLNSFPG